jgi:hypothetical protein
MIRLLGWRDLVGRQGHWSRLGMFEQGNQARVNETDFAGSGPVGTFCECGSWR